MQKNVSNLERAASVLIGAVLLGAGIKGKKASLQRVGSTLGGISLMARGLSGRCPIYEKLDVNKNAHGQHTKEQFPMERSIIVNKPLADVEALFRERLGAYGILATGTEGEYSGQIGTQTWLIHLEADKTGKRTFLKGSIPNPDSPSTIRRIFSTLRLVPLVMPDTLDLRKVKALIETGEIPTIKGQSHGERSNLGRLLEKSQESKGSPRAAVNGSGPQTSRSAKSRPKNQSTRKESPA